MITSAILVMMGISSITAEATGSASIQYSNGALVVYYNGSTNVCVHVVKDSFDIRYFSNKSYISIPLTRGTGRYDVVVNEAISNDSSSYVEICTGYVNNYININSTDLYIAPTFNINWNYNDPHIAYARSVYYNMGGDRLMTVSLINLYFTYNFTYNDSMWYYYNTYPYYKIDTSSFFNSRTGYCEQYAVAFAEMMRSLGIPAKVVYGLCNGEEHAWNEVYLNGIWTRVDNTVSANQHHTGQTVTPLPNSAYNEVESL